MIGILRAFCLYFIIGLTFLFCYIIFKVISLLGMYNKLEIKRGIFTRIFLYLFKFIFWINIQIEYQQVIDLKDDKYLFLSNHTSYMDLFLLIYLSSLFKNKHKCKFVGMQQIFDWLIVGYVLKELGMIPIKMLPDNNNHNQYCESSKKLLKERCRNELINGNSIFMFPEGRLNDNPSKLNKIYSGAYYLSKETNTPIKIIGLKGIDKVWKKYKHPVGYGKINIKIFNKKYLFKNKNEYKEKLKEILEKWINIS